METEQKTDKKPVSKKKVIFIILYVLLIVSGIVMTILCRVYIITNKFVVEGSSMEPTFYEGYIVNFDRDKPIEIGDVVTIRYKLFSFICKRVIALPGDEIVIKDGVTYVNGEYSETNKYGLCDNPGRLKEKIILGPDEYFVMGDNRNASTDSRSEKIGNIKAEKILGVIVKIENEEGELIWQNN